MILLTLSWRGPLPYRSQSIDLQSKSMDWFLYNNGLSHERVKLFLNLSVLSWCIKGTYNFYWLKKKCLIQFEYDIDIPNCFRNTQDIENDALASNLSTSSLHFMQIWQELIHAKAPELKSGLFRFTKIRSREKKIISWKIEKWVFWEFCQKSQAEMQVNSSLSIFCCFYHE